MRVRCSQVGLISDPFHSALYVKSLNVTSYFLTTFHQGLQVQDYFGNFCKRVPTDIDLPAVSFLHRCTVNLVYGCRYNCDMKLCLYSSMLALICFDKH